MRDKYFSLFFHVSLNCRELLNQNHFVLNHQYLPRVAHHNGDNSVHQRQRDCHTLGKPSGLTVRCLAETMGERPCFAFASLSKYDKDTMPIHLTRCWKATKHLRGTRTKWFSQKLSFGTTRDHSHVWLVKCDWRTSTIFDLSSIPHSSCHAGFNLHIRTFQPICWCWHRLVRVCRRTRQSSMGYLLTWNIWYTMISKLEVRHKNTPVHGS